MMKDYNRSCCFVVDRFALASMVDSQSALTFEAAQLFFISILYFKLADISMNPKK